MGLGKYEASSPPVAKSLRYKTWECFIYSHKETAALLGRQKRADPERGAKARWQESPGRM